MRRPLPPLSSWRARSIGRGVPSSRAPSLPLVDRPLPMGEPGA